MLSIFIMYSTDRAKALDYTLSCLRDMPLYDQCQRTLVVDGKIDTIPADWQAVQVPRVGGKFCWARMWDAGVYTAQFDKIIYLDSDRLLPKGYLEQVNDKCMDDVFIYTSRHFMMTADIPLANCKKLLEAKDFEEIIRQVEYLGKLKYETRFGEPFHGPSKNVMSGSTAFTKRTYWRLGGVDHWYCGHGAYADSDFHMAAAVGGCAFVDLDLPELHFPHAKLAEDRHEMTRKELFRAGLDNFIYYCYKWGLPLALAESLANRCYLQRPQEYVRKKIKKLKEDAKGSN